MNVYGFKLKVKATFYIFMSDAIITRLLYIVAEQQSKKKKKWFTSKKF